MSCISLIASDRLLVASHDNCEPLDKNGNWQSFISVLDSYDADEKEGNRKGKIK